MPATRSRRAACPTCPPAPVPRAPRRLAPVLAPFGGAVRDQAFEAREPDGTLDGIWASHVLEHSPNPGAFLARCRAALREDGWLAVVVPPFKPRVVMGHISPGWNTGILMYALAAAGFDPARGHFLRHGYNVAGFVPKDPYTAGCLIQLKGPLADDAPGGERRARTSVGRVRSRAPRSPSGHVADQATGDRRR